MTRSRSVTQLVHRVETPSAGGQPVGSRRPDDLAVEEPLEIRLDGAPVTTTMRTPGHDFELAVGFCFTDGRLGDATVQTVRYCATGSAVDTRFNVVTVETNGRTPVRAPRENVTTSACGICGTDQIHELRERLHPLRSSRRFDPTWLAALTDVLAEHSPIYASTGAVHAAACVDPDGQVMIAREDVGRHNAVDKVIGRMTLDSLLPADDRVLVVSSRAGFEIVQKAWAAGFRALVTVGAPTALAVETARAANMMLVGFVRDGRANVYAGMDE
jgi:FdhD protein